MGKKKDAFEWQHVSLDVFEQWHAFFDVFE
jgi:hypothetical protein